MAKMKKISLFLSLIMLLGLICSCTEKPEVMTAEDTTTQAQTVTETET